MSSSCSRASCCSGRGCVSSSKGIPALLRGAPDMNSLVAVGTSARLCLLGRGYLCVGPASRRHGQCLLRSRRCHRGADPAWPLAWKPAPRATPTPKRSSWLPRFAAKTARGGA
ncbi:hypothetical protein ACU4GD_10675 [Cupriavidus basilensis]